MNVIATTPIQQQELQHHHHHHHHNQLPQDEINYNHARSHSDPTKNNSTPLFHHLKTPESETAKLASSLNMGQEFSHSSIKRRRLDLGGSDNEDNEIMYDSFKRSRTAPPSPPYEIDEDLRLKSPLVESVVKSRSLSLSPAKCLPTPLVSSDPIQLPSSPMKSAFNFTNSMNEYPDTCYKYTAPHVYDRTTDLSGFENPYNREWKQRLEILVKADDPITYSKFKDYCNDVSKSSLKLSTISFNSRISKKIQKTANKKLADVISSKYQRNDKMKISSIINFPFENNYTYQSTGYLHDIDTLNRSADQFKRNHSINLSKYNHIFSQMANEENHNLNDDIKRRHYHHQDQQQQQQTRRKSQYGQSLATGLITTDLPLNFATKSSKPQLLSPPQHSSTLVQNTPSLDTTPHLHTFVHNTITAPSSATTQQQQQQQQPSPKSQHPQTARILPPSTPKQTSLPSPATSPSSKYNHHVRTCISCKCVHSPCWRPSWSITSGQLCNSCGLRYKKTGAHCLNEECLRIPAKGEWTLIKNRGKLQYFDKKAKELKFCYKCLHCGSEVQVNE